MSVEITVQLYPAAGGGVQVIKTPEGAMPVPVPFINYERVRVVEEVQNGNDRYLKFVTRAGDEIRTNIPYLIKRTNMPEGEA